MPGFNIPSGVSNCGPVPMGDGPRNVIETARAHRYMLQVLEPLGDTYRGLLLFLAKCTRPGVEVDQVAIHSGQDEIHRPGKHHWKEIEFTFYEVLNEGGYVDEGGLTDNCAKRIWDWWAVSMIDVANSRHRRPEDYLKRAQLDMLDGQGSTVWRYFLYDCWPCKVTPSDLAYRDTDIAQISVSMRYSKAWEG